MYKLYTHCIVSVCVYIYNGRLQRPRGMIFHHVTLTCSRSTFRNALGQSIDRIANMMRTDTLTIASSTSLVRILASLPKKFICTLHVFYRPMKFLLMNTFGIP